MRKVLVSALTLLLFPAMALATGGASGSQPLTMVAVDTASGFVEITGPANWGNPDGCTNPSTAVIPFSNSNYRDLLANALMASAADKNVQFWFIGCATTPWGTEPIVVTVMTY